MKKYLYYSVVLLICAIFGTSNAFASHGTGGELTWTCLGTGQYVFQMKFYRDCNGISPSPTVNISTTVPGLPFISLTVVSQTDISNQGFMADGITNCPSCTQVPNPAILGLVEEFFYESVPVTLNGIPPATGWEFSYGECCRNTGLTNIASAGSLGFLMRSKMFSFNGQNADPCFDSSPYFAEKPALAVCTGLPVIYHHLTADVEFDSLVYEFDSPLDEYGNQLSYSNGFTVSNPLPGNCFLNALTGELSFTPLTGGYFVVISKVSSYRCGIKIAEIRRESNLAILNNCNPLLTGTNYPPLVNAPFIDASTGIQTSYADTVVAGDTVDFDIFASDFDIFTNSIGQIITLNTFGRQYGFGFTNAASGCLIPPCATLNPPPPLVFPVGGMTHFNWVTSAAHLGYSLSCVQFSNTYYFMNKVRDNYCPANGTSSKVFSITVLPAVPAPPVLMNSGNLECNLGSSYIYQWFFNRVAIPGATASSYMPSQIGTYQVLAIAPDGQGNYSEGFYLNSLGITESGLFTAVTVQSNPSTDGIFMINSEIRKDSRLSIYVMDVYGRIILSDTWSSPKGKTSYTLDLSKNADGVYMIELRDEKSGSRNMKLVKSK